MLKIVELAKCQKSLKMYRTRMRSEYKAYATISRRTKNLVVRRLFQKMAHHKQKSLKKINREIEKYDSMLVGLGIVEEESLEVEAFYKLFPLFPQEKHQVIKKAYRRELRNLESIRNLLKEITNGSARDFLLEQREAISGMIEEMESIGLNLNVQAVESKRV